jgi:hypothetical protein
LAISAAKAWMPGASPGKGCLQLSRVTPLDRTSSELLNRTAVGLTRPSALNGAIVPVPVDAQIKSGHDG